MISKLQKISAENSNCFSCQKSGDLPFSYSADKKYEFCSVQCMSLIESPCFKQLEQLKKTNIEQEKEIQDMKKRNLYEKEGQN